MNTEKLQNGLSELLSGTGETSESSAEELMDSIIEVQSFEDACVLTRNKGLIIILADGSEFQVTIVKSLDPELGAL